MKHNNNRILRILLSVTNNYVNLISLIISNILLQNYIKLNKVKIEYWFFVEYENILHNNTFNTDGQFRSSEDL